MYTYICTCIYIYLYIYIICISYVYICILNVHMLYMWIYIYVCIHIHTRGNHGHAWKSFVLQFLAHVRCPDKTRVCGAQDGGGWCKETHPADTASPSTSPTLAPPSTTSCAILPGAYTSGCSEADAGACSAGGGQEPVRSEAGSSRSSSTPCSC